MKDGTSALLLVGGEGPSRRQLTLLRNDPHSSLKSGLVICADSGLDLARRLGLSPDWVVGDMDSLRNPGLLRRLPPHRVRRAAVEKDKSDTEMGLDLAWELGAASICIVGGEGGRLDHIVALLRLFDRRPAPDRWIGRHSEVIAVHDHLALRGRVGETISLFPTGDGPWRAESHGLHWQLNGLRWRRGDYGLSNRVTGSPAEIVVFEGDFILVRSL